MSENPYGPPVPPPGGSGYLGYPPPHRRGWPSWVIVVVGVVSGIVLAGASTVAVGLAASSDDTSSSSSASAPAHPSPGSSSPGGTSSPPDDGSLQIDFPDGSTGRFAVPDGLHHDQADDDGGHVALESDGDSAAYLDVYTDETTASQARDLHLVAAQNATDDRNHGNQTTAITYGTVGGHQAAQYRFTHHDGNGTYDGLVTVVLVGDEQISLYWSDDVEDFSAKTGQLASASVLHSLQISDGGDSSSA